MTEKKWCAAAERALEDLYGSGLTALEIADEMHARFGHEFTRNSILGKANKMGLSVSREDALLLLPAPAPAPVPILAASSGNADIVDSMIARLARKAAILRYVRRKSLDEQPDHDAMRIECGLHLVDLKRAGFRRGHGELNLEAGEYQPLVSRPVHITHSLVGSTAAMCAGA